MNVSPDILRKETIALIRDIDKQIDRVKQVADEAGIPIENMRDRNGVWIMPPLLLAKAQAYNTLVLLQTKK